MARLFAASPSRPASAPKSQPLSVARKKAPFTPEHRAHMSEAQRGKKHSPETIAKISASRCAKPSPAIPVASK